MSQGRVTWGRRELLPTKTLRALMQLFRRAPSLDGACSQIFTTRVGNPLLGLIVSGERQLGLALWDHTGSNCSILTM